MVLSLHARIPKPLGLDWRVITEIPQRLMALPSWKRSRLVLPPDGPDGGSGADYSEKAANAQV